MRKVIIMFALAMGIITANAQENVTVGTVETNQQRSDYARRRKAKPTTDLDKGGLSAEGGGRRPVSRADKEADLRPHDTAARIGSDLRQDRPRHFSGGGALCRFRLARPDCGQSRRSGERHPREGYREELPERNQYVRNHGGREFLHL
jgi:hypothetical protein